MYWLQGPYRASHYVLLVLQLATQWVLLVPHAKRDTRRSILRSLPSARTHVARVCAASHVLHEPPIVLAIARHRFLLRRCHLWVQRELQLHLQQPDCPFQLLPTLRLWE